MPFLIPADYEPLIRAEVLTTVTANKAAILASVELTARAEMESYLRARYDVVKVFPDVTPWALSSQFNLGALAYHGTPQIIYRALADSVGIEPGTTGADTSWQVKDPRHALIRTYLVDIALYHAHSAIPQKMIPELRVLRYEAAMEWLKAVAAGKLSPDLPLLTTTDGTPFDGSVRLGSHPRYSTDR